MSPSIARAIDHLVLPVDDLDVARSRFNALGFTVAPDGSHPFGTRNANIFFPDGTFMEPIAIADRDSYEAAKAGDNSFVRNDVAFRSGQGKTGFSHVVMSTDDATADDRLFRQAGYSGGAPVFFSREFASPGGDRHEVAFRLAFASASPEQEAFFFTCEQVRVAQVDRSALLTHANGARGLTKVVCVSPKPYEFDRFFGVFAGGEQTAGSPGLEIALANGTVSVLTPETANDVFAFEVPDSGYVLRHIGVVLATGDLSLTQKQLQSRGVTYLTHKDRLIIPPAPGQKAYIAFEEQA